MRAADFCRRLKQSLFGFLIFFLWMLTQNKCFLAAVSDQVVGIPGKLSDIPEKHKHVTLSFRYIRQFSRYANNLYLTCKFF